MLNKKILHVVSSMNPILGGVCKAVDTIAVSLLDVGINNEVVCLDEPDSDFIANAKFKIYALGNVNNPWGYHPRLLPWLKENMLRYDVIIVHGLWLFSSYAVQKAIETKEKKTKSKQMKTQYFVMPHGMLDPYFQKAKGRKLKALRNSLYWKVIERKVVNNANGILFTCQEEQFLAKKPFAPYKPKNEIVVGLGIEAPPKYHNQMDIAFFEVCPELKSKPFLLFLSRIHEKKGVDILLEAYEKVVLKLTDNSSNSSDKPPKLVIAGPGLDSEYGKLMLEKVEKNSILKEYVFFPGMLSGDTKWGAFYNCDAFVLPSHQENFGIAIVEAMACSKPVLISNKINIWKEIDAGFGGIVNEDTVFGTIENLEKWIRFSDQEKISMQKHAKSCYHNHFALDAVVNNWQKKIINNID